MIGIVGGQCINDLYDRALSLRVVRHENAERLMMAMMSCVLCLNLMRMDDWLVCPRRQPIPTYETLRIMMGYYLMRFQVIVVCAICCHARLSWICMGWCVQPSALRCSWATGFESEECGE